MLSLALAAAQLAAAFAGALVVPACALASLMPPRTQQVTGKLIATGAYSFTVQTPGRPSGVLGAVTRAATRITRENYPYVWGGGHRQAGIASIGIRGPGHNGRRRGYDCSGAVAAVLVAGGLWPAGQGVPSDAGVIRYLRGRGEIAPGAGTGPREVTLYDEPGVHIFMNIDGRFFGTSDGGGGGDARGGPGWLDDGASDAHSRAYRRYHFLPSLLRARTNAGYTLAFQFGPQTSSLLAGLPAGIPVRVAYRATKQGTMVAEAVSPLGETTVSGTVEAIAAGGTGFTLATTGISATSTSTSTAGTSATSTSTSTSTSTAGTSATSTSTSTSGGQSVTFPAASGSALMQSLVDGQIAVGDTVSVSSVAEPVLTVISVTVTAAVTTPTSTTGSATSTNPATPVTTTTATTPATTTQTTQTTPTTTATTTSPPLAGPGGGSTGVGSWSGGQGF